MASSRQNQQGKQGQGKGQGQRGRPSSYRAQYSEQATKLCRLGAKDTELAEFFGVSEATLNNWKQRHPEFLEALKAGRAQADMEVANSLYHRAVGFSYVEQQAVKVKVGKGEEDVKVVEVQRFMPPDTTAQIFWLKNRRRDEWRDKQDHDHRGKLDVNMSFDASAADEEQ